MTDAVSQSEYNERFLDRIKAGRPDMLNFVEKATHAGVEYIKIEIPPPAGQEDSIVISTYGPELTMFYHAHHAHFDMFADGDEQGEFDELFDYVDAFMNEELVAISEYDGQQWCGSSDRLSNEFVEPKKNRKIVVRSWKGTYSKDIE